MHDLGFIQKFLNIAYDQPGTIAIEVLATGQTYSYEQLLDKIETWLGIFEHHDISQGDFVLLLLDDHVEFVCTFYALASCGAVCVPTNPQLTTYELEQILKDAKPACIITSSTIINTYHPNLVTNQELKNIFTIDDNHITSLPVPIYSLSDHTNRKGTLKPPSGNPVIGCHYTYKGIGYPLGALHRYNDYNVAVDSITGCRFPQEPGSANLIALPLYPVFGLTTSVLYPLNNGCRMLCVSRIMKQNIFELLVKRNIRLTFMVPDILQKLVFDAKSMTPDDIKRLHPNLTIVSGGSYLDQELSDSINELTGIRPYQGYGTTETLPVATSTALQYRPESLGLPLSNKIEIKIKNINGEDAHPGQIGEILIKGKTLFKEYLGNRRMTARYKQNGWFRTGDIGYMDNDGYLFFVGRSFYFTKIGARMVDLFELESLMKTHRDVSDARAIYQRNEKYGDHIISYAILKKKTGTSADDLRSFLEQKLSRYKIPKQIKLFHRNIEEIT